MSVLGAFAGRGAIGRGGKVGIAVFVLDKGAHSRQRVFGNASAVGTHVSDEADGAIRAQVDAFVQALGGHHGAFGGIAKANGRLLLERTGRERLRGPFLAFLLFDLGDDIGNAFKSGDDLVGLFFGRGSEFFALLLGEFGL